MKRAFLSGITGQSGSHLADLLLAKGYEVHGLIRRSSSFNTGRIDHIFDRLHLHHGDLTDAGRITQLMRMIRPGEVYNLGCQSHVGVSFDNPAYTVATIVQGTLNMLEAARAINGSRSWTRFYQASSSEMFGNAPEPQNEDTPFDPQSPYACAKVYAYHQVRNYRKAYGLFASNGILFNHEGPRRGETFVTRKITRAATRIKLGLQKELLLGNLDAQRDWGYAGDYVEAMWLMLQHDKPDDFVIGTGAKYRVMDFADMAFDEVGLIYDDYVRQSDRHKRPADVHSLLADASKAKRVLGWERKHDIEDLVKMMIDHDMELAKDELKLLAR